MKVLHVTESLGGGITSAINAYVKNSSGYNHALFAAVRDQDVTGEENHGAFSAVKLVPRSRKSIALLKNFIEEFKPDVIHLHSAYAGAIVRVLPFVDKSKIVYTPHAYAFLRDDNPIKLKIYYIIEWLLARRTAVTAGCGRDEMNIAKKLHPTGKVAELINICGSLPEMPALIKRDVPVVLMIGRICAQKGYEFFARTAELVKDDARFVWVGGGDEGGVAVLKQAGVEITGWVKRDEALSNLAGADLYFHTAAWDGFPISVLEAAEYKRPLLLREIGPFSAEGLATLTSPEEAAAQIRQFVSNNKDIIDIANSNSSRVREYHSAENLQAALKNLYEQFA